MNIPKVTISQLLEAGVHLGHKTHRWNPKMKKFIFGKKDSVHIIDLTQTLELLNAALKQIYNCVASGGKVLFVSTKKQASEIIRDTAKESDQYYVNYRWLGGMLTNWKTISNSIKKYKKILQILQGENKGFTKKEILKMGIQKDKLERSLGGIAEMKKIPDLIFVIDTNIETLAINEASKLKIPIVAIIDTNSNPDRVNFPIPGNDDARRSISLYCEVIKATILDAKNNIKINQPEEKKVLVEKIKITTNTKKKQAAVKDKISKNKKKEAKK